MNIKAMKPSFVLLVYQNIVAWLTLSVLFIAASILCKQKRIRIIDFLGTVLLARFPILISLFLFTLMKYLDPVAFHIDYTKGIELHLSLLTSCENLIIFASLAWQLMTYFFAFKESSGIEGKNLWVGFISAILLGEVIATIFTRWFLYV